MVRKAAIPAESLKKLGLTPLFPMSLWAILPELPGARPPSNSPASAGIIETMNFLRNLLIIAPAACLLAQTPPAPSPAPATPPAAAPAAPKLATPIPPGLLSPAPVPSQPVVVPPDRVVLKAGPVTLTAAQFDEIIDSLPAMYQGRFRGPGRRQFADSLVRLYILSEEGRRRKLDETKAYKIQSQLNDDQVLVNMVAEDLKAHTTVDEADARKYYDEHATKEYELVTASHILIRAKGSQVPLKPGAKELTEEEALAKANDLRKRIVAGEDFATLAKAESDDAQTAAKGGSLGAFARGRMVPSFDEAAFKLKPGELSEPVKSPYGYHIIKVESHTTKTFDEVRGQIMAMPMLVQAKVQKTLEDMTKDAFYDPEFFAAPPKPPTPPMIPGMPPTAARPGAQPTLSVQPVPAKPAAPAAAPQK